MKVITDKRIRELTQVSIATSGAAIIIGLAAADSSAPNWRYKLTPAEEDEQAIDIVSSDYPDLDVGKPLRLLPDGENEAAFASLDDSSPELAGRLREVFAAEFLRRASGSGLQHADVIETTDLRVASFPAEQGQRLRLTSKITGSTQWYIEWDGSEDSAGRWIESEVAPAQAASALRDGALRRRQSP